MIERLPFEKHFKLSALENEIISRMYASWCARAYCPKPIDQTVKGIIGPSRVISIDNREKLEKAGVLTIGADCKIWGRQMSWASLLGHMNFIEKKFEGCKWGLLTAASGEFLVPDRPPNNFIALPVTPQHLLLRDHLTQTVSEHSVREVNKRFIAGAWKYFFANKLRSAHGSEICSEVLYNQPLRMSC